MEQITFAFQNYLQNSIYKHFRLELRICVFVYLLYAYISVRYLQEYAWKGLGAYIVCGGTGRLYQDRSKDLWI